MALSFFEPRLPPLGNTFIDIEEVRHPFRLLRQRSVPGFVPYWLGSLEVDEDLKQCGRKGKVQIAEARDALMCCATNHGCVCASVSNMQVPPKWEPEDWLDMVDDDPCTSKEEQPHQNPERSEHIMPQARRDSCGLTAPPHMTADEVVTTLMVRNLPGSVSQTDLIDDLNACGFRGLYDFCYMPSAFDWSKGENRGKGYAFINFVSSVPARELVRVWHLTLRFGMSSHGMGLNISAAAIQGLDANIAKWSSPRFRRIRNSSFRPFIAGAEVAGGPFRDAGGAFRDKFSSSC